MIKRPDALHLVAHALNSGEQPLVNILFTVGVIISRSNPFKT
jgi:hypothetical protein